MKTFFESIRIENGLPVNLNLHIKRMNIALKTYFPNEPLFKSLELDIPEKFKKGLVKCRVVYSPKITTIDYYNYKKTMPKNYVLVVDNNINYSHKFLNREKLNSHIIRADENEEVILVKHQLITDSINSNLCFWDGKKWVTPKFPLLKGTKRAELLLKKEIFLKVIFIQDILKFEKVSFINAMNNLGEKVITIN